MTPRFAIDQGDVIDWCVDYAQNVQSGGALPFHGVLCDPPYCLEFMGAGLRDAPHREYMRRFPNQVADLVKLLGCAPWEAAAVLWYRDVFAAIRRCVLPGAPLLACAGPRTDDLMGLGLRAAGWDLRDKLIYMYGSGMPHGLDLSKAIDARAGAERAVVGQYEKSGMASSHTYAQDPWTQENRGRITLDITEPATAEAASWAGYNTQLKPAYESILYAVAPFTGTFVDLALDHGTAGLNIGAARVARGAEYLRTARENDHLFAGPTSFASAGSDAVKPSFEPDPAGRYPSNVMLQHSAGCELRGVKRVRAITGGELGGPKGSRDVVGEFGYRSAAIARPGDEDGMELIEDWRCEPDCPIALLDGQSGATKSVRSQRGAANMASLGGSTYLGGSKPGDTGIERGFNDAGGASRFFYTAKVAPWEREAGLDGMPIVLQQRTNPGGLENDPRWAPKPTRNPHPTLKSIRALVYLAQLMGRPAHIQGRLLVPFAGVASEMAAGLLAGWSFVQGIELDADERYAGMFIPIGLARLAWWSQFETYEDARRAAIGERVYRKRMAAADADGQLRMFT